MADPRPYLWQGYFKVLILPRQHGDLRLFLLDDAWRSEMVGNRVCFFVEDPAMQPTKPPCPLGEAPLL